MDIYDVLSLVGGLALFLFGMSLMGTALEKRAGTRLKTILASITSNPFKGFLLGLGVTAVIQSSSATTVMVVGFVNSGIMTLRQAVGVIMGANLGTSVTSWILSLTGIKGDSFLITMLKPSSFTPILALVGVILYMFTKSSRKKDTGLIFLGFAILMFGMETMSAAVSGLSDVPGFAELLLMFSNPILGVLAGAALTAVIQSSSASVGILQALTLTGSVTYAAAIPIIMGQNIGTCITAIISSVGASKNAKRAAMIHLYFNFLSTLILLPIYWMVNHFVGFAFSDMTATPLGIAICHSAFNVLAIIIMAPCTKLLERLATATVRDGKEGESAIMLDERLLATPSIAIERCRLITSEMAEVSAQSFKLALEALERYDVKKCEKIRELEERADQYEDALGTYLVKVSSHAMSEADSDEAAKLLHMIGDLERISDHAVNLVESAEEMTDKKVAFSFEAVHELKTMADAVTEMLDLSLKALNDEDSQAAMKVEPLDDVVDKLEEEIRARHIVRLQKAECTIEMGFILSDILTNLERAADHCSNIAGCVIEMSKGDLDLHRYTENIKENGGDFARTYSIYNEKYSLI